MIASSKRLYPLTRSSRMPNAMKPVMTPATTSGTWKSRLSASAAPRNSAMSVDIETISAWTHIPHESARG